MEDSLSSPAARKNGAAISVEEQAAWVTNGKGSKCVISTEPAGAEVYVNGLQGGITPLIFGLMKRDGTPWTSEIRLNGYKTIEKHLVPDGQPITIDVKLEKQSSGIIQ